MIKVTIELCPRGDCDAAETLQVFEIVNEGPADPERVGLRDLWRYTWTSGYTGTVLHRRGDSVNELVIEVMEQYMDRKREDWARAGR